MSRGGHVGGALEILEAGPLALVEDLGRPGHSAHGVGRSGAADRGSLRLANRLVGNRESAAGLEVALGPFAVRFTAPAWFALAGAVGEATLGSGRVESRTAVLARAGAELRVGVAALGLRHVLAVRGGIATDPVLGSRSVDTLAGLGAPLRPGDRVPVGAEVAGPVPAVDAAAAATPGAGPSVVRAHPGPRSDWFTPAAIRRFYGVDWRVTERLDRVGMTLEPPAPSVGLERSRDDELPSEAMVPGAVQVAPSGAPTVLLADHPVTGGYPVIAVVAEADLDVLAQRRPGDLLRFRHPLA